MKKVSRDEIDREILSQIPLEKHEEVKRLYRLDRYKQSGQFFFLWNGFLFLLSIGLTFLWRFLFPFIFEKGLNLDKFFFESTILSTSIFSFFQTILFTISSKEIRLKLNQKGISALHAGVLLLLLIYITIGLSLYVKRL